jgi:hypothetical protein
MPPMPGAGKYARKTNYGAQGSTTGGGYKGVRGRRAGYGATTGGSYLERLREWMRRTGRRLAETGPGVGPGKLPPRGGMGPAGRKAMWHGPASKGARGKGRYAMRGQAVSRQAAKTRERTIRGPSNEPEYPGNYISRQAARFRQNALLGPYPQVIQEPTAPAGGGAGGGGYPGYGGYGGYGYPSGGYGRGGGGGGGGGAFPGYRPQAQIPRWLQAIANWQFGQ